MATLTIPNTIIDGTANTAAPMMANFDAIVAFANASLLHRDGTLAMTGQLSLVGDPVSAAHAARKAYVDGKFPVVEANIGTGAVTNGKLGALSVSSGKIASGAVTAAKLGTDIEVVTDRVGVTLTDTQSCANGTTTDVTWGTEVADTDGFHSGSSATVTLPSSGLWAISFRASNSSVGSYPPGNTPPSLTLTVNGNDYVTHLAPFAGAEGHATAILPLPSAAEISCAIVQHSGFSATYECRLDVYKLGV